MSGRYRLDRRTALGLKIQDHSSQLYWGDGGAQHALAYLMILTIGAAKIAPGKEYGSRSPDARQWRLFAEVRKRRGYRRVCSRAAKTRFARHPVHFALPGTQSTRRGESLGVGGSGKDFIWVGTDYHVFADHSHVLRSKCVNRLLIWVLLLGVLRHWRIGTGKMPVPLRTDRVGIMSLKWPESCARP